MRQNAFSYAELGGRRAQTFVRTVVLREVKGTENVSCLTLLRLWITRLAGKPYPSKIATVDLLGGIWGTVSPAGLADMRGARVIARLS